MIFLLIGCLLLILKLSHIEPVAHWNWISISVPFFLSVIWFEIIEPVFGLDVRRQQRKQAKFFKSFVNNSNQNDTSLVSKRIRRYQGAVNRGSSKK